MSDVRSCELGVLALVGVGVPVGVDRPTKGDLELPTLCTGEGV